MIPILYESITAPIVPNHYGLGSLTDCLSCEVTEERNGIYTLTLTYPATGIHADEIAVERFIKVKPNYMDDPQLFRIYKVGKVMAGKFTVYARHLSYDMSDLVITGGSASSCAAACLLLTQSAGNFTITTDKATAGNFTVLQPSSVRSWFGGKKGSLLDVYGGEWHYDNFGAKLKAARGTDRNVTIRYGKNLTALNQIIDTSNLLTGILPFYMDQNGNKVIGAIVPTGLTLDRPKVAAIDFTQDVNPESSTPIATQLANLATSYKNNNNLTTPINSITLDFVQMKELTERVDLCDTVSIYFEALGIEARAKCVKVVWDVLEERYTKTTFGDARTNIADTIVATSAKVANTPNTSFMETAIAHATELITGNRGGNVVIHKNEDGRPFEILVMDTDDINTAVKLWRWGLGGFGYSKTGYEGPYGTAITMNGQIVADYVATGTLDASKITVQNLSASSITTGTLDGTKATIKNINASNINTGTLDGTKATISNINASNINSGTLNANLIKAGTISDVAGNSSINMANGEAIMKNFKAKLAFSLVDSNNVKRGAIEYNSAGGTAFYAYNQSGKMSTATTGGTEGGQFRAYNSSAKEVANLGVENDVGRLYLKNGAGSDVAAALVVGSQGGTLSLRTLNGSVKARMDVYAPNGSTLGGALNLYNYAGVNAVALYCNNDNAGYLMLRNASNAGTIYGNAHTGNLTCTSLTQTSSRKVKENIKPIVDAEKILELEAVSFDYKDKARGTDKRGFIAEDVAEILPNLVTPETEEMSACLDYIQMIPYLQAVIKMQDSKIKALEQRLEVLENKLKEV